MVSDPGYNLHKSVYDALKPLASGNVFYRVPANTKPPYLHIGNNTIASDYDSYDMSDCTVMVYVIAADKPSAQKLAGEVRTALDKRLAVEGFFTVEGWLEEAVYRTQQDGVTELCTMDFHYLLLPSDPTQAA